MMMFYPRSGSSRIGLVVNSILAESPHEIAYFWKLVFRFLLEEPSIRTSNKRVLILNSLFTTACQHGQTSS